MTETTALPLGINDVIPPEAFQAWQLTETLLQRFFLEGYDLVAPPLLEFADHLAMGNFSHIRDRAFTIIDPLNTSAASIMLRPDMTVSIARLVQQKLAGTVRPLRLCYAGDVLLARADGEHASDYHPRRQFTQLGLEMIGADSVVSDLEIFSVLVAGLNLVLARPLHYDLSLPSLAKLLLAELPEPVQPLAKNYLITKDLPQLKKLQEPSATLMIELLEVMGDLPATLPLLKTIQQKNIRDKKHQQELARFIELLEAILAEHAKLHLTLDLLELKDFDYKTGFGFTLFDAVSKMIVGRGGRYLLANNEPAVGCSLYLDSLMPASKIITPPVAMAVKMTDKQKIAELIKSGQRIKRI